MDTLSAIAIAQGMCVLSMTAAAIGEGWVLSSAFGAIGRNPKLENSLLTKMLVTAGVVETTALYALLAFFILNQQFTALAG